MTKRELKEIIRSVVKEYTGIGASGGNATDGNNITSPRIGGSFNTDEEELEDYNNKNAGEGGQGLQTRGMEKRGTINYNRAGAQSSGGPRFENKTPIKENFDAGLEDLMGKDDYKKATSKHVPGLGDVANIDDKTDIGTGKKTFMQMMMAFTDEPFLIETGLNLYDAWSSGEGGLKPSRILDILKQSANK